MGFELPAPKTSGQSDREVRRRKRLQPELRRTGPRPEPGVAGNGAQTHRRADRQELSEARSQPEPSLELGPKYVQENRRHREAAVLEIPLLGRIAAGLPVESVEQRATLSFADFVGHPGTFALEVRGESMIGDHICDGDMVLLERATKCATAKSWWRSWKALRQRSSAFTGNRAAESDYSQLTLPSSRS